MLCIGSYVLDLFCEEISLRIRNVVILLVELLLMDLLCGIVSGWVLAAGIGVLGPLSRGENFDVPWARAPTL